MTAVAPDTRPERFTEEDASRCREGNAARYRQVKWCWVTGTGDQVCHRKPSEPGARSGHCLSLNREFPAGHWPGGPRGAGDHAGR